MSENTSKFVGKNFSFTIEEKKNCIIYEESKVTCTIDVGHESRDGVPSLVIYKHTLDIRPPSTTPSLSTENQERIVTNISETLTLNNIVHKII